MSSNRYNTGSKVNQPFLIPSKKLPNLLLNPAAAVGPGPAPQPSQNLYISGNTDTMVNPTYSGMTMYSTYSGNWSDPNIWSLSRTPQSGDKLVLSPGLTVVYDYSGGEYLTGVSVLSGATLRWSPTTNTQMTVVSFVGHPYSTVQVGVSGTPIASGKTAEIVIADVPLNTTEDPFQFWNGFVNWGTLRMYGQEKTSQAWRLTSGVSSGATTLTFSGAPTNWWVGDTLVIPDSRRLGGAGANLGALPWEAGYVAASETVVLASGETGTTMFLSGSATYGHPGVLDISGQYVYYPHVGNLTRNVRVYSANPSGTRGHVLLVDDCDPKIHNCEFRNMARTKVDEYLDNTTGTYGSITHVGTNQVGRYGIHLHHVHRKATDPTNFELVGNSVWSTFNPQKWGIVAHDSPYGVISNNVIYNVKGWGIGTEQGSEIGLTITNNFVSRSRGSSAAVGLSAPDGRGWTTDIGFEGYGMWFRSTPLHTLQNNVIADCLGGIGCFNTSLSQTITMAAGPLSTDGTVVNNPYKMGWSGFSNNEVYGGCMMDGFTFWDAGTLGNTPQSGVNYVIDQYTCWHVNAKGYSNYRVHRFYFDSPRIYGNFDHMYVGNGATAFYGADYVAEELVVTSGIVQGTVTGWVASSQGSDQRVRDSIFACYNGFAVPNRWGSNSPINVRDRNVYLQNILYLPLLSGNNNLYSGKCGVSMAGHNLNAGDINLINNDKIWISGHNRVSGANYRVYFYEAGRSEFLPQTNPSGSIYAYPYVLGSPFSGLTNIENWSGTGAATASGYVASGICRMNSLPPAAPISVSGILGLVEAI